MKGKPQGRHDDEDSSTQLYFDRNVSDNLVRGRQWSIVTSSRIRGSGRRRCRHRLERKRGRGRHEGMHRLFCPNKTFTIPDFKKTREQLVHGYFYSADSLKIFVKTERHSLIRLAEVGSAFSFKWVLRQ